MIRQIDKKVNGQSFLLTHDYFKRIPIEAKRTPRTPGIHAKIQAKSNRKLKQNQDQRNRFFY